MTNVAFLGLGAMGAPMARRILGAGFPLRVWNRNPERARPLVEAGARGAATPRDAAAGAGIVCTMLADPEAVDDTATGPEGLVAGLGPDAIWLDFSTVAPGDSRRWAALARKRGADFCDVPVAGSVAPAADGTLKILAGGEEATLERAQPVLAAVSKETLRFGPVGQGSAMKLVNNLLFGVEIAAFSEALLLADRLGLGAEKAAEWLLSIPAASPYMKAKWEFMRKGGQPPNFSVALMAKDLRLMAEAAPGEMEVTRAAHEAFRDAASDGFASEDIAHLIRRALGRVPG